MDALCAAFENLTAACESGTMKTDLVNDSNSFVNSNRNGPKGRQAGMPSGARPGWAQGPSWAAKKFQPYNPGGVKTEESMDKITSGLASALQSMAVVSAPIPQHCGCPKPTRENILKVMIHRSSSRNRWEDAPLDVVRQKVSTMAVNGTEDNSMCVPWRVCRRDPSADVTQEPPEGHQYEADFVYVAPSPERYYEGDTIVFTPKISVQSNACIVCVLTDIECKFKACWETAHIMSLGSGADYQLRLPYTRRLLADLARSCTQPDATPWAITRPYARPPTAKAPPVPVILDLSAIPNPTLPPDTFNAAARTSMEGSDFTVGIERKEEEEMKDSDTYLRSQVIA